MIATLGNWIILYDIKELKPVREMLNQQKKKKKNVKR